jgi:alpha-tubulin suppressor-like RCC1 family protein
MTSFPTEAVRVAGLAGASAVAVGAEHGCAIVASGDVMCWGSNHSFALGLPNPSMEARPHTPLPLPGVSGATAIASSSIYSCAIVAEGGVRCWGGYNGSTPQSVGNVSGAKALAVGSNHACAAVTDGEVRCWGPLSYGPSQPAVGVRGFSGATALAASGVTDADGFSSRACAIVEAGRVWCWARNVEAAPVDGLRPVLGLATGGSLPDDHTCVVLEGSGEVRCWGSSSYGQLGDGTIATTYIKTPVAVVGLP